MIFYITKRGEKIKMFENSYLKNLFVQCNNLKINECKMLNYNIVHEYIFNMLIFKRNNSNKSNVL